jgi:hypothetical protein
METGITALSETACPNAVTDMTAIIARNNVIFFMMKYVY